MGLDGSPNGTVYHTVTRMWAIITRTMHSSLRAAIAVGCLAFGPVLAVSAHAQSQTTNAVYQTPHGLGQFPYTDRCRH
jgi:hypothetical protein